MWDKTAMFSSEDNMEKDTKMQDETKEEDKENKKKKKKEIQGRGNTFQMQMQMLWMKGKKIEARFQKYVPKLKLAQKPIRKRR